jgi:hypothetical protein
MLPSLTISSLILSGILAIQYENSDLSRYSAVSLVEVLAECANQSSLDGPPALRESAL